MGFFLLLTVLILTCWAGFNFSLLVKPSRLSFGERCFLSWPLGMALLTYCLFLGGALGLRLDRLSVVLTSGFLAAALFCLRELRRITVTGPVSPPPWGPLSTLLLMLIVLTLLFSGVIGLYWPVNQYDAMDTWAVRGMAIAGTGSLSGVSFGRLPFYPLNVSLGATVAQLFCPGLVKLLSYLTFVSLLGLFYFRLRDHCNRPVSLFFTLFLATVPYLFDHSTRGFADLPFGMYAAAATLYLLRFFRTDERNCLWLSGWLSGMAIWTKAEGWSLLIVNSLVAVWYLTGKKRLYYLAPYLGLGIVWGMPWNWYAGRVLGSHNPGFAWAVAAGKEIIAGRIYPARAGVIVGYLLEKARSARDWGYLGGGAAVVTVLRFSRLREWKDLGLILLLHFALLVYMYYGNPLESGKIMHQTVKREYVHLLPLVMFYLAVMSGEDLSLLFRDDRWSSRKSRSGCLAP